MAPACGFPADPLQLSPPLPCATGRNARGQFACEDRTTAPRAWRGNHDQRRNRCRGSDRRREFQRLVRRNAGAGPRRRGDPGRARARGRGAWRSDPGDPRPGADRRRRGRTRPASRRSTPACRRRARPSPQPGLWLGAPGGGHGRAAHPARRRQDRHRRRPGEHVAVAARRVSAGRPEDGRPQLHRHDDQGRPLGRLQRLPHGHDRRERGETVPDHPRAAGRVRPRQPEQGRGGAEGRQVQGRDHPLRREDPEGRDGGRRATNTSATARPSRRCRSCARRSRRTAR